MIDHITQLTSIENVKTTTVIYYRSGYRRVYLANESLPDTALDTLLNGNYYSKYISGTEGITSKYERYTPKH